MRSFRSQGMFAFEFLIIASLNLPSWAEYRAYELMLVDENVKTQRTILTTLDDRQFPQLFPVKPSEKVTIKATWMCRERSDYFKPICPNPAAKPVKTETASSLPDQPALSQTSPK